MKNALKHYKAYSILPHGWKEQITVKVLEISAYFLSISHYNQVRILQNTDPGLFFQTHGNILLDSRAVIIVLSMQIAAIFVLPLSNGDMQS